MLKPSKALAFADDIRTKDAMLNILINVDDEELGAPAKRALYGAVYMLAKRLEYDDIVDQYEKRLYDLPR